jgi:hypothetical protein
VGARSLGQARPRLVLESWSLAAVKLAVRRPSCAPWRRHQRTSTLLLRRSYWRAPPPRQRGVREAVARQGCPVIEVRREGKKSRKLIAVKAAKDHRADSQP